MVRWIWPVIALGIIALAAASWWYWGAGTDPELPGVDQEQREPEPPKGRLEEESPAQEKTVTRKPGDYFPLTPGSRWDYHGEGNEYASFTRELLFVDGNRGQIREDNGGTVSVYIFEVTDTSITRIFHQPETYDRINLLDQNPNDHTVILGSPLKPGTRWETSGGYREIVAVDAVIDTPAGEFRDCIQVKIPGRESTVYEYFKDGVGMVKREFISGDIHVTSSLERFTIK